MVGFVDRRSRLIPGIRVYVLSIARAQLDIFTVSWTVAVYKGKSRTIACR